MLSQSSIRPSIYFSSIVKSRSNPFLKSTSTKPYGYRFLLKEATGAVDEARMMGLVDGVLSTTIQ